ncbi:hypothetical protein, partial [uncultured Pseudomonas sp.]|uniref:hypothetical protein n=1 Tax=uncultured Pseudomonas sp. TaxID=114707 RepID=UPI0028061083
CFFMVSPSLSLAFYKNATVAHRRLGLGESIQLHRACSRKDPTQTQRPGAKSESRHTPCSIAYACVRIRRLVR